MRGFTIIVLLHRDTMLFVLFQEIHNVNKRIRVDRFRDGREERGIESSEGSVVLEGNLIHVTGRILFLTCQMRVA